ncbi:MAG: EamA family transporter [Chloroflexi bacterium]|nr:EamA family transporter [Chloroflexota bacterium]
MTQEQIDRRDTLIGYAAAIGAAACYGALAVLGRKIALDIAPPLVANTFSMILGTLVLFAIFQSQIRADYRVRPSRKGWLFVALAGCASTWGVTFWFLALGKAPAILVAPLAGTSPLFALIMTLIFLRGVERVTIRTFIGTIMVIIGVALITLGIE